MKFIDGLVDKIRTRYEELKLNLPPGSPQDSEELFLQLAKEFGLTPGQLVATVNAASPVREEVK